MHDFCDQTPCNTIIKSRWSWRHEGHPAIKTTASNNPMASIMASIKHGRGTARSIPWASPLAYDKQDSGGPDGTVGRGIDTDSCCQFLDLNEGAKPDEAHGYRLRIGCVNVGTLARRSGEVVGMVSRRKLDFCCVQKTRWKGEGERLLGGRE